VRIALADARRPLDPALAAGRDQETLARALFATPLRTDAAGALRPGLCSAWGSPDRGRTWRFRCRHARTIADELRRVRALAASPAQPLLAAARSIDAPTARSLVVRLRFPWRRFPYVLTTPAAAPRAVPGPFRVVLSGPDRLILGRPGLRLVFVRMAPLAAVRAFRAGRLEEAPVPEGDLAAARDDPSLRGRLHVRPLDAVDLVQFRMVGGALADLPRTRRVYWQTAQRGDYDALVPERAAPPAFGLLPGGSERARAADVRAARGLIPDLPSVDVPILAEPRLADEAELVAADWRDLGLGARVVVRRDADRRLAAGGYDAAFRRLRAPYAAPEALLAALLLPKDGRNPRLARPSGARSQLVRALGGGPLERADATLQHTAAVVPLARVAGARLVSRRLAGWRQDPLGVVDYRSVAVRGRESSRSR
jgi:hypothetical protein